MVGRKQCPMISCGMFLHPSQEMLIFMLHMNKLTFFCFLPSSPHIRFLLSNPIVSPFLLLLVLLHWVLWLNKVWQGFINKQHLLVTTNYFKMHCQRKKIYDKRSNNEHNCATRDEDLCLPLSLLSLTQNLSSYTHMLEWPQLLSYITYLTSS